MNSLGLVVDICRVGPATALEAIRRSRGPVIFRHSSAAALVGHPSNLNDETIRAFRDNGGVIGVTPFGPFCSSGCGTAAALSDYRDHVEHKLGIAGPDQVGIGTDIGENVKVLPIPAPYEVHSGDGLERRANPRTKRPLWPDSSGSTGSATGSRGWPSADITTARCAGSWERTSCGSREQFGGD